MFVAFLDFKAAYDSVDQDLLMRVVRALGLGAAAVRFVEARVRGQSAQVVDNLADNRAFL